MNPYLNRLMIRDPAQFYGRRREVSRILSRIASARPQSVSVVGERRIGKSSLLYHLSLREVRDKYLGSSPRLTVVFLDFQQLREISPADFYTLLIQQTRLMLPDLPDPTEPGHKAFQQLLERLERGGQQLTLLLDEFEAVTSNPSFTKEFYSFLRSMANHYPISYVTSSKTELQQLCHSTEISDSPFFNIFSNLYLNPFEREEALDLIRIPSEAAGLPLSPYMDNIVDMAGLLPFYLQIACCAYFDWLTENPGGPADASQIEMRFLEEATPHFDYQLQHLAPDQRRILDRVVQSIQPGVEDKALCQKLSRSGYLLGEGRQCRVASRLLRDHLVRSAYVRELRESGRRAAGSGRILESGARLEQYEIVAKVGEGGMGQVYQAHDTILGRKVALKVIKPELLYLDTSRQRFLREARLAAALSHSSITSIYELLESGDLVALVMEWLEGRTLSQLLVQQGRIGWHQLVEWLVEAAAGLDAAHRQGIVHRDIKTSNIMITSAGRLKILDFGLAKHLLDDPGKSASATELTSVGMLIGTVDYMSPEQACGQPVDARSDLFSLGVVLFEGLTGSLPFHRRNTASTLQAIVNEPVPDLALYDVEGAEHLDPLLRRLLNKDPADRYQSANQLAKDLKSLLESKRRFFRWLN